MGDADKAPLVSDFVDPAHQKLPEAACLFDLTKDGFGLHLCRDMGGVRLRRLRARRLCSLYRGLAGQPDSACEIRAGCTGTGYPRARSEERREGKESVRTGSYRWSPD